MRFLRPVLGWFLTLAIAPGVASGQKALSGCQPPNVNPKTGNFSFTFSRDYGNPCSTFDAEVSQFDELDLRFEVKVTNRCTGDSFTHDELESQPDLRTLLDSICGPNWFFQELQNFPIFHGSQGSTLAPRAAKTTSAAHPAAGQAAQGVLLADLNGDGIPDTVQLAAGGISVQLQNSDGSLQTAVTSPTGFAPDLAFSTLVAADFNGDGKIDLAVSNPGTPGTDPGGVAILLGNGDGTFQAAKSFPAGQNPGALAAADFNGDGKMDVAAASSVAGPIVTLSGNGNGTLGAPVPVGNGSNSPAVPVSILAIDLNGDGRPDLAVANQGFVTGPTSSISTLLNTGSGFNPAFNAPLPLAIIPSYLAYADLDHDGNTDLIAVSSSASAMIVLLGKGNGTFQNPAYYAAGDGASTAVVQPLSDGTSFLMTPDLGGSVWVTAVSPTGDIGAPALAMVGGAPTGVAVGDLNGDGQPDAVVTGGSSDVSVLLGNNGQFQNPVGYALGQPSPLAQAAVIGDLNGDGKPDVVVASAGQAGSPGVVSVLLGNGDGTLRPAHNANVNQNAQSLALADLNGDGKLDAAVAAYGSSFSGTDAGAVDVLLGNGDGTFQSPATLTVSGLHPQAVAVADLNGDKIPDIAAVVVSSNQVGTSKLAVFLGKGDGTFQSAVTFPLQSTGGQASGIAIADWNRDSKLDVAAVSQSINSPIAHIDVLLGDGTGKFASAPSLPVTEDGPVYLATADLNQDGVPDLLVGHCCGQGSATYLYGNGDGTFQTEAPLLTGNSTTAVGVSVSGLFSTIVSADSGSGAATAVSMLAIAPVNAVVSAASVQVTNLAPASLATAYGSNLATGTESYTGTSLPGSMQGTSVTITDSAGNQATAPVSYVSPSQVNFLVPANAATGAATVSIVNSRGVAGGIGAQISPFAPGIFQLNASGLTAAIVVTVAPDGTQTYSNVYSVNSSNAVVALPLDLSAGPVYLELYGTGIRGAPGVTVTVGGQSVPVLSWGAQGQYEGLDQVNIGPLPASLKGTGQANIVLQASGQTANTVNLTFR